ncbi:MAG TPA: adenosylcobinamide-phosphate synthase CbiB [Stellaceae bacterium]|nr:adenosylcobinamide-phosphate synthase CbiB [Stellaceae bacterium]
MPVLLGTSSLVVLLLALAFDGAIDFAPVWHEVPHPVAWVGAAVTWLERHLNRPQRSEAARRARGVITVVALVLTAGAAGVALEMAFAAFPFGFIVEACVVAILLAQRSLFAHVAQVADALESGGLAAGRTAVARIVGRDPDTLDAHGVARAAIESLAENFGDGVVGPALYFALFGLPGMFVYKTTSTLDSMIGHRSPRYLAFGWAAARFDDLLNFVPARLAALFLGVAAFALPAMSAGAGFSTMLRDGRKHRSPNAGWPEAAAAGALGLALGGPRRYEGALVEGAWLGEGRARATTDDIARALRLYAAACLVQAGLVLVALGALRMF